MKKNLKVMVVDDEVATLRTITKTLEKEGFCIKGAMTGEEALALSKEFNPDVVLMDIRISGFLKSGIEVVKFLNNNDNPPAIAYMTGHGREEHDNAQDSMYHHWINKPINFDTLGIDVKETYRKFIAQQIDDDSSGKGSNVILTSIEEVLVASKRDVGLIPSKEYLAISNILFIKRAKGQNVKQVRLFTKEGKVFRVSGNLASFVKSLDKDYLIQINGSVAINAKFVTDMIHIEKGEVSIVIPDLRNKFLGHYLLNKNHDDRLDAFTLDMSKIFKRKGALDLIAKFL